MSKTQIDDFVSEENSSYIENQGQFIALLAKAFDIQNSETGASLKNTRSADYLEKKLYYTRVELVEHIANDENQQCELFFLFEFVGFLFVCFNRYLSFKTDFQVCMHKTFERDVVFKLLHLGFKKTSTKSTRSKLSNIDSYKSEKMTDYLSVMLNFEYLQHSKDYCISWLEFQNKKLPHGIGSEIKRFTSRYKNEKSIKTLGSIRATSKLADDELITRLNAQYPTSREMQSFLCSSMAIQYIQKNIDFTLPKINHFQWLAKEITILYLKYHRNRNSQENGKYELLEKVNQKFAESSFSYLKETFKNKPYVDGVLRYKNIVKEIQSGNIITAFNFAQETINNHNVIIQGCFLSIIYMFYSALEIKINALRKHTPNEYKLFSMKSMEFGGMDFIPIKSQDNAFPFVNSSLFFNKNTAYILIAVSFYGECLSQSETLTTDEKTDLMICELDTIEKFLSDVYSFKKEVNLESIHLKNISKIANKYDKDKNQIKFINQSNLYTCLAELNSLVSYWPDFITDKLIFINKFCKEPTREKRKLLLAINQSQYALDARDNTMTTNTLKINNLTQWTFYGDINLDVYYYHALHEQKKDSYPWLSVKD